MTVYEVIDITDAKSIFVYNEPFQETFFLLQVDREDATKVNGLVWDAIGDCEVERIVVENNIMEVFIDEEYISIDTEWDKSGKIDFYELENQKADEEIVELADSLGIYIVN